MESVFEWDEANVAHLAAHDVRPDEAEEALLDPRRVGTSAYQAASERRWAIIGATEARRVLLVVLTRRGRRVRVITARNATTREGRRYRR